jgi:photosystem II stability/assembly factor-like uncharacterized protein
MNFFSQTNKINIFLDGNLISVSNIGMSYDGKHQTVFGSYNNLPITPIPPSFEDIQNSNINKIIYSNDFGTSWNSISNDYINNIIKSKYTTTQYEIIQINNIKISDDGSKQLIIVQKTILSLPSYEIQNVYSYVFGSSDYAFTWSLISLPQNVLFTSCDISSTGKYQIISCLSRVSLLNKVLFNNDSSDNGIYYSLDYGNTWKKSNTPSTMSYPSICMTSDGLIQKTVGTDGYVYTSTDYGINWKRSNNTFVYQLGYLNEFFSICVSGNTGQYQTIFNRSNIFVSSDYGKTWYNKRKIKENTSINIFISNTGQYQFIKTSETIYTSTDYGNTWNKEFVFMVKDNVTSEEKWISSTQYTPNYNTKISKFILSKDLKYFLFIAKEKLYFKYNPVVKEPTPDTVSINISNRNLNYLKIPNNIQNSTYLIMSSDGNNQFVVSPTSISKISESKLQDTHYFKIGLSLTHVTSNSDCSSFLGCGQTINEDDKTTSFLFVNFINGINGITWLKNIKSDVPFSGVAINNNFWNLISNMNISYIFESDLDTFKFDLTNTTNYKKPFIPDPTLEIPEERLSCICSTPDGKKQVIITIYGSLFIHENETFSVYQNLPFSTMQPNTSSFSDITITPQNNKIAMDDSGTFISICQEDVGIFISNDGGRSFTTSNVPVASWKNIKISKTGQYQIAISSDSGMYMSNDFGTTWSITNIPNDETYVDCALSSSGEFFTALSSQNIYQGKLF